MASYLRKSSMGEDILLYNIAVKMLNKAKCDIDPEASVDEVLTEAARRFFPNRRIKGFGCSVLYFY